MSEFDVVTDPDGYSINLCKCDDGPYLGARRSGKVCCCERCGLMTPDQWEALRKIRDDEWTTR